LPANHETALRPVVFLDLAGRLAMSGRGGKASFAVTERDF